MKRTLWTRTMFTFGVIALGAGCAGEAVTEGADQTGTAAARIEQVGELETIGCRAIARFSIESATDIGFVSVDAADWESSHLDVRLMEVDERGSTRELNDSASLVSALRSYLEERLVSMESSTASHDIVDGKRTVTHEDESRDYTSSSSDQTVDANSNSTTSITSNSTTSSSSSTVTDNSSSSSNELEVDASDEQFSEAAAAAVRSNFSSSLIANSDSSSLRESITDVSELFARFFNSSSDLLAENEASAGSSDETMNSAGASASSTLRRSVANAVDAHSATEINNETSEFLDEVTSESREDHSSSSSFDETLTESSTSSYDEITVATDVQRTLDQMSVEEVRQLIDELEEISNVLHEDAELSEEQVARSRVFTQLDDSEARNLMLELSYDGSQSENSIRIVAGNLERMLGQGTFRQVFEACAAGADVGSDIR